MKRFNVIFAFVLREIKTRFGYERFGYFWMLFEPVIHIVILVSVFSFAGRTLSSGLPFVMFVGVSILPWLYFTDILKKGMSAIDGNRGLLLYPAVKLLDPFLGRVLVETLITTVTFTLLLLVVVPVVQWFGLLTFSVDFVSLFSFVSLFLLLITFAASFALVFMVLFEMNKTVKRLVELVLRPMYFISAIFYSPSIVPTQYQWVFSYNPLTNFIEGFRSYFFLGYETHFYDVTYLLELNIIFLFLGLFLYTHRLKRNLL